jgi:hypothetical protein
MHIFEKRLILEKCLIVEKRLLFSKLTDLKLAWGAMSDER